MQPAPLPAFLSPRSACAGALVLLLGACATPYVWFKPGTTPAEFNQDAARCRYEAAAATANYNTGRTAGTMSGAVAQGLGEGLAIASRRDELIQLCLQARGYTKRAVVPAPNSADIPQQASISPVPVAGRAPQAPPAKITEDTSPTDPDTQRVVQFLAESGFPLVGQPIRFKRKDSLTFYEVRGAGGRLTQVVCDQSTCRWRTIQD